MKDVLLVPMTNGEKVEERKGVQHDFCIPWAGRLGRALVVGGLLYVGVHWVENGNRGGALVALFMAGVLARDV